MRVVRAPTYVRASTAPVVPSWPGYIRRSEPDVLHVHMPNPTGELAVLASRTKKPIVAHYHADIVRSGPVPAAYERFAERFLRRVHTVAVGSKRLAETTPLLQRFEEKVVVIPYGVDVDDWVERPARADEIRLQHPGPLLVLLGRLVHYKGAEVAVEAMRDVDATLLIVGDGPMRAGAEARAAQLGVSDRVRFIGEIADDERSAYYHAADVFVSPGTNRGESYGIVQVEAMATGTPSISTELGTGTSWVNQHGETGLVVAPRDASALANAINALLGEDEMRTRMGRAAAERVRNRLTRQRMLADIKAMYERAARGGA